MNNKVNTCQSFIELANERTRKMLVPVKHLWGTDIYKISGENHDRVDLEGQWPYYSLLFFSQFCWNVIDT